MDLIEKIKELCDSRDTTLVGLERELGFSRGSMRKWNDASPSVERLQKVADYFNVSTDYLLGRTEEKWTPTLTEKDKKDIAKEVDELLEGIDNETGLAFDGYDMELDEETKRLLKQSLTQTKELARLMAKKKFTPKKYRK